MSNLLVEKVMRFLKEAEMFEETTNTTKLRSFQCRRTIKQRVFRKARKDTWNKFVNSLNSKTQTKKVWNKFRKVTGNYKPRTVSPLERS